MHLLAAQLNFGAGAQTCDAATDAALAGEQLLDKYNFNGTGSYLRPKGATRADYYYALDIAKLLDEYNNGLLCGAPVVTDVPPAVPTTSPLHVGNLSAVISTGKAGKWNASVTVTIHDESHSGLAGAAVSDHVSVALPLTPQ